MRREQLTRIDLFAGERPAPLAVAPEMQRIRALRRAFRHGIEPRRPARPTAANARKTHPAAAPEAKSSDCFARKIRAARQVTALAPGASLAPGPKSTAKAAKGSSRSKSAKA